MTIVELLISSLLVIVIIAVAYGVYTMARDVQVCVFEQGRMQNKALFILERMIHGVGTARKGIEEAQDILSPAAGAAAAAQIQFVDQDDATMTRSFYLLNSEVRYIDSGGSDTRLDIDTDVEGDVQTLTFTRPADNDDLIEIGLILQKTVWGKSIVVDLSTSVRLRNM